MRRTAMVLLTAMAVLSVPMLSSAVITCEHFNYGPAFLPLTGLGGGENWGGAWAGYDNLSPAYHPDAGLAYSASCYTNAYDCNDADYGGTVHQSYRGAPRAFPQALTGTIWVSALVRLGANDSFRGFTFSNNELSFGFGINSDCRTYIYFADCDTAEGGIEHSTDDVHLVIARVVIDPEDEGVDIVSVWVDPDDTCSGEPGLGEAEVELDGCDVASSWATLMFELGNGSNLDAIRVSHGNDACLEDVLRCPPTNPVERSSWGAIKKLFR